MTIPYNEAGQRAFEVFTRIAARLYADARAAVDAFTAENCPESLTLGEKHADGKYQRTVRTGDGINHMISYDYEERRVQME